MLVSFGGITTAVLLELSIDLPQPALSALSVVKDHKLRTPGCRVPSGLGSLKRGEFGAKSPP